MAQMSWFEHLMAVICIPLIWILDKLLREGDK